MMKDEGRWEMTSPTGTPFVADMSHQTPNAKAEIEEITSCFMFTMRANN